jgi:hypothetical protein
MAKFYGKNDSYLIKNDLKYYSYAVGLVILVLLVVWSIFKFALPAIAGVAALVGIFFLVQLADPFIMFFRRKANRFYRGWSGEMDIKRELENFSDEYSVFWDIVIGQNKGNIDFVVVGPNGVFMLEVKSHKGEVGFNGREITLNGRNFPQTNVIKQVHGETWALKNYIKQQTGAEVFVHSVLLFSSPYARMRFGYSQIENMSIIQKDFLPGLFARFPAISYNRPAVELVLAKAVV